MSGSNGILKHQNTNRENQILNPKTRLCSFKSTVILLVTGSSITATSLFDNEISFNPTTPTNVNLDTLPNIVSEYNKRNTYEIGAGWNTTFLNTDPSNPKTITLPAGITAFDNGLQTITIPNQSRVSIFFRYTSVGTNTTLSAFVEDFSGTMNVLQVKQGASTFGPLDLRVQSTDAPEVAFWTRNYAVPGVVDAPSFWSYSRGSQSRANLAPVIFPFNINPLIHKLSTNTNSTSGTTLTSISLRYNINNGNLNPVTGYVRLYYLSPSATDPVVSVPVYLNNTPALKPAAAGTVYFTETLTLTPPLQLTDLINLYFDFYVPIGGLPATATSVTIFDVTAKYNYQLSN